MEVVKRGTPSRRWVETPWTPEREDELRVMWGRGDMSTAQIAEVLFGSTHYRSSVVGKIHRLKLTGPRTGKHLGARPGVSREGSPARRTPKVVRPRRKSSEAILARIEAVKLVETSVQAMDVIPVIDTEIPVRQRKALLELTSRTCKWPVGTPGVEGFFFCGGEAAAGYPYCPAHAARAFSPQSYRVRPHMMRYR